MGVSYNNAGGPVGGGGEADPVDMMMDAVAPHLHALRQSLRGRVAPADIDDVVQETLLRICSRRAGEPVTQPRAYLFQTAHAVVIDRHRREAVRCQRAHCELSEANHPVDHLSPLRILLAREQVGAVEQVLSRMPERTRDILVAMRLEGATLKCLARRFEISTSAVEKHVTRAMKQFGNSAVQPHVGQPSY